VSLLRGSWTPSNTTWPGPWAEAYLRSPYGISVHPAVWPQPKHVSGAGAAEFPLVAHNYFCDSRSPLRSPIRDHPLPLQPIFLRDRVYKSSAVAEMGDRGHNRHWPKRWGRAAVPFRTELGPRLIQWGMGRGLLPYQVASSSIQSFGHNRHWTKIGGCARLGEGKRCVPGM